MPELTAWISRMSLARKQPVDEWCVKRKKSGYGNLQVRQADPSPFLDLRFQI